MPNKTWFITGTSRGFGHEWTKAALERGDRVAARARDAGYGHFGMVEEISEQEARAQIETNLFGALWVTQAALPFLRARGSGHIVEVSSIGGISAFPSVGSYHASKWGVEGISQALAENDYEGRLATWREWQSVAELAEGDNGG